MSFLEKIHINQVTRTVKDLITQSNIDLSEDFLGALEKGRKIEESPTGVQVLTDLVENARIARQERMPVCQDTGIAIISAKIVAATSEALMLVAKLGLSIPPGD